MNSLDRLRFTETPPVDVDVEEIATGAEGSLMELIAALQDCLNSIPPDCRHSASISVGGEYLYTTTGYSRPETDTEYTVRQRKRSLEAKKRAEGKAAKRQATIEALGFDPTTAQPLPSPPEI